MIALKIAGVIAEFNPFHNGHEYLLKKIKQDFNPDLLVVSLSGYFTMRGELSINSPFLKAKYALNEANLVIELPTYLALNSADKFAEYSILELNKVGVTDLFFGSEENNIKLYEAWDESFKNNQKEIKKALEKGESYKMATNSVCQISPNDLLGYSYYKAIKKHKLNIKIHPIKREGSIHGENTPNNNLYASSSAIRNNFNLIDSFSPSYVSKENLLNQELLFPYFKFLLLSLNKSDYLNIAFISEGIENLLLKNIKDSNSFQELIEKSANRRYTKSRIRRSIVYIMFRIPKLEGKYEITRVLGYDSKGKAYLNSIKKNINIKTNIKDGLDPILDIDLKIAKILDLVYKTNNFKLEQGKPVLKEDYND